MANEPENRLDVVETRTCVEVGCNNTFTIKKGEREYMLREGLVLPKRCGICRMKKRKAKGSVQL